MRFTDQVAFAATALSSGRARLILIMLAMAVGVGSVSILTALGNGARDYITREFSALGNRLLIVLPGRNETTGGPPPMLGSTPRPLTLDDALALARSPAISQIAPVTIGNGEVSYGNRSRDVVVMGTTPELQQVREIPLARGRFLPISDPRQASAICVIGEQLRQELFGRHPAVGEWLRIDQRRFRITGILQERGQSFDLDWNDMVVVPVAAGQTLFNTEHLFRILVSARSRDSLAKAKQDIVSLLRARHEGEEDVTVITQDAMLGAFDKIFTTLTLVVAGIAAISMAVAGILIMNVMLVSVSQRTTEVGLIKALGASRTRVSHLFLLEAFLLCLAGAGALFGEFGAWTLRQLLPDLPAYPPLWARGAALVIALLTGLVFGLLPARRAAQLDPVQTLNRK